MGVAVAGLSAVRILKASQVLNQLRRHAVFVPRGETRPVNSKPLSMGTSVPLLIGVDFQQVSTVSAIS